MLRHDSRRAAERREADDRLSPAFRAGQSRGDRGHSRREDRRATPLQLSVLYGCSRRRHPAAQGNRRRDALRHRLDEKRFAEVEEMAGAILRFPRDRLATFICSFGTSDVARYQVVGTKGDQFAPELLYFSECIQKNRQPEPSGWEGLADVRIIASDRARFSPSIALCGRRSGRRSAAPR